MDEQEIDFLTDIRSKIVNTSESSKQKEIVDKLDELILAELNKTTTQEPV